MGKLTIECDTGKVSDGYHTFDELYDHRYLLFGALIRDHDRAWKSKKHLDGSEWDGWFIAGWSTWDGNAYSPEKAITYHIPMKYWNLFHVCELEIAPEWDGHTSADVIKRLEEWLSR